MWKLAFLAFAHNPRYASADALRSCKRHTGEDEVLWISQVPQGKTHSRRSETRMIPDCAGVVGFCQPLGIHPLSRTFRSDGGLGQLQKGNARPMPSRPPSIILGTFESTMSCGVFCH